MVDGTNEPERVLAFAIREASRPGAMPTLRRAVRAAIENTELASPLAKVEFVERIVGSTIDWKPEPSGPGAAAAARPVARLCSTPDAVRGVGFATGFMISHDLLLTNAHVFEVEDDAEGCYAQFGYESVGGRIQRGAFFVLEPQRFFFADKSLDFALVAVSPRGEDDTPLALFGGHPILADEGKILIGHPIAVIQHPDGAPRRYAEAENLLTDILPEHLHYATDTQKGSSGSPCFNQAWEVVALHHTAVPLVSPTGQPLRRDGVSPWDPDNDSEDELVWVANEGVRISKIASSIRSARDSERDGTRRGLLAAVLHWGSTGTTGLAVANSSSTAASASANRIIETATSVGYRTTGDMNGSNAVMKVPARSETLHDVGEPEEMHQASPEAASSGITIHVDVPATIHVRSDGRVSIERRTVVPDAPRREAVHHAARLLDFTEAQIRFDENYANRQGYDTDFLGERIPLPTIRAARRAEMMRGTDGRVVVVPYHHFSLAMNGSRRLQMWSAVNVDYSEAMRQHSQRREAFGRDTWRLDPRVPERFQIADDEFYKPATNIDRGHMVRRDDNAWGSTFRRTEFANSDTFHWTNCTPQHERFNQSREPMRGVWGRLEDTIKGFSEDGIEQSVIFSGPVLAGDDPDAYGIQYPLKFWKVFVAFVNGQLEAYGFVLDQAPVVERFGLEERLDFGRLRVHQRSIEQIEELTGVDLPDILQESDVLGADQSFEVRSLGGRPTVRRRDDRRLA